MQLVNDGEQKKRLNSKKELKKKPDNFNRDDNISLGVDMGGVTEFNSCSRKNVGDVSSLAQTSSKKKEKKSSSKVPKNADEHLFTHGEDSGETTIQEKHKKRGYCDISTAVHCSEVEESAGEDCTGVNLSVKKIRNHGFSEKTFHDDCVSVHGTHLTKLDETVKQSVSDSVSVGAFDNNKKEWIWPLSKDLHLRVGKFRGKPFVDVRHLWQGNPTKKGAFLSVDVFRQLQAWPKLDEALEKLQ